MKKLTYVLFALLAVPLVAQAATTDAEELGRCIYNNTSSVDKDTLVQFMYVSLSSTNAARKIQTIPQARTIQVNAKTKNLATKLVLGPCRKQALRVLLSEPKRHAAGAFVHGGAIGCRQNRKEYVGMAFRLERRLRHC